MTDPRVEELEQLVRDEDITLPYPPAVIVGLEDQGKYVDLETGLVGDSNERVALTVVGEAVAVANRAQGGA